MSDEFTEAQLTAMLPTVYDLKRQREAAKNVYDKASKPFRDWLDAHPDDFLRDGETGIVARLQERSGTREIDIMRIQAEKPSLLVWLASQGCLRLDAKALQAMDGKAVEYLEAVPYVFPGRGSVALLIEKERD